MDRRPVGTAASRPVVHSLDFDPTRLRIMASTGGDLIRRLIFAAGAMTLVIVATPRTSSAAFSLALARADYPSGSHITGLPATNHEVNLQLGPVHRSTFDQLHRIDGDGWLQAAVWHFTTGRGANKWRHRTIFLYAINIFHNHQEAMHAVVDEKIRARASKVAHLPSLLYRVSDVHGTLVFAFFAFREVEVEAYYEYKGVAPTSLAASVRHKFSTQTSHLAQFARRLSALDHQKPTSTPPPTDTALATSTATPIPSPTIAPTATVAATLVPVPTSTSTLIPTAIETSTPAPTPTQTVTPAPTGLVVQAAPQNPTYSVRDNATILVHALLNGQPAVGASVDVSFFFPGNSANCAATIDASGNASCSAAVPVERTGVTIQVNVQVVTTTGVVATTNTSFTIR
jgi:hypothetical protein